MTLFRNFRGSARRFDGHSALSSLSPRVYPFKLSEETFLGPLALSFAARSFNKQDQFCCRIAQLGFSHLWKLRRKF